MKILEKGKSEQLFLNLSKNTIINYNINNKDRIKKEWESNRLNLRGKLKDINLNFLSVSGIGGLMFQSDIETYKEELKSIPKEYYQDIVEYSQSNPNTDLGLSTNTIHHLFHLHKFLSYKNLDISEYKSKFIVEWGGGYGNLCKILIEKNVTKNYLIVDVPEFLHIQYLYLSSYFGEKNVNLIKDIKDIKDGINLISVDDIVDFPEFDTFISTWALTESTTKCQEICINNKILDKNLILAYHQCGDHIPFMNESKMFHETLLYNKIYTEEFYIGGGKNYYAFK